MLLSNGYTHYYSISIVLTSTPKIWSSIHQSIRKFFNLTRIITDDTPTKLRGQCSNSGGGGTLCTFTNQIKLHNIQHHNYLISSCTLHNLQTALQNAVVNVLGDRELEDSEYKLNIMQVLNGCYNIKNWHESQE